jgi:hypothetical protein
MRTRRHLIALAAVVGCVGIAVAADQTILGKSITVKQKPADATSRKVTASGKEKNSPNTIVGNPLLPGPAGGGILQVFANGGTPTSQTFNLPQGTSSGGNLFWLQTNTGWKYKDARGDQGPVKSVLIKKSPSGSFSIKAKINAKNGTVNVVPPNPGTSACLAVQLGSGDRYSVQFGPESQIKNKLDQIFKAKKPTAEGICPGAIPTTSTTTSTTTTSSSTTTLYGSPSRAFLERIPTLLD